ncbi:hypothetical protein [Actinokineospora sp. HUAS TT18]|uniref:hypothetical protein n=1 Tax=Actinokineospora sp. HUAS TT18 TaxID=3447451 RepID=UPI003F528458
MAYTVDLTDTRPRTVLRLPGELRFDHITDDVSDGLRHLYAAAGQAGLSPAGPPEITYLGPVGPGRTTAVEFAFPLDHAEPGPVADGAEVVVQEQVKVARTEHVGPYDEIGAAHDAVARGAAAEGYEPAGPPTECYLVGPDKAWRPGLLRTEVRLPIRSAKEQA